MSTASPILVVDDEPHIRRVTELSMKPLGHRVLVASNGREALAIARREKPCIILLDHIMPVMDGMTALEELKIDPNTRDIPVVILSSRGQLAVGHHIGFEEATMFIAKPFSPTLLRKEIERLIASASQPGNRSSAFQSRERSLPAHEENLLLRSESVDARLGSGEPSYDNAASLNPHTFNPHTS